VGKDAVVQMRSVPKQKASAACYSPGFFHLLVCVCAAILGAASALSQEVRVVGAVRTSGNEAIATSTIREWMETKPGRPFVRSDIERIAAGYALEGFLSARVDSVAFLPLPDSSAVDLLMIIREGKKSVVGSLQLEGVRSFRNEDLESTLRTRVGEKFAPALLERDIASLLDRYEKSGYPFARVELGELQFSEKETTIAVSLVLKVEEGGLARIRDLRVEGNTTTKTGVIAREARVTEGEIFRGDQLANVKRRLERMQLFSSVSMPELFVNGDGSVGVSVKVAEGNPNRFDGVVGYAPAGGSSGGGTLTGLLDVQFRNILGTGRRLSAHWYRETESSQEIELHYREPWVASLPINAEAGLEQRKQDSTYVRNTFSFSAELMATDEFNLGVTIASERVLPTEGFGRSVSAESRTTSVGVSVLYDSRNDPITPTSGLRYRTEYQTGIKQIENSLVQVSSRRSATQRLAFDIEYFSSPIKNQVLAASLCARDFRSDAVEQSDMFRLGGSNTLRGYREGQFLGSRVAWSSLEYRLLTGQRSFAFGFFDIGYVLTPQRPEAGFVKQELSRIGYGVGIRLDTPLGLLGMSLAFGEGDTFSTAKLHLRLINEF
jgi:outer membrane protein assembly factor BamA